MTDFIPQIQPWIDDTELQALKEVIDSTYITEHEKTKEFEAAFCKLTGAKHAVAYCNGTMALTASLLLLNLKPDDEVIVPALTFIATSNAVILAGGTPVLCDVDPNTFQMDLKSMEEKISPKTKAIIPVPLYGLSPDMDQIMAIAKEHNLFVLEDAAESIGTKWKDKHVGTFGDIGMISFYANKTVTTAEGGILLTNNEDIAKELYKMKNHGRPKKGIFIHESIGYNFSFSDLHAAVGLAQLSKLDKILAKKTELHKAYQAGLKAPVKFPTIHPELTASHWFVNIIVPDAEALQAHLEQEGIGTRRLFYPLHRQPCYQSKYGQDSDYPGAVQAFNTGLSLPSSYNLTDAQLQHIIQSINNFYA